MNNVIELHQLGKIIRKYIFTIVFLAVSGGAIGYSVAQFIIVPTYSASTSMLVNRSSNNQAGADLSDQQADVQIINTYKNLVISSNVLTDVSKSLRSTKLSSQKKYFLTVDQLKKMVTISNEQGSQVFSINVKSTDPTEAAKIANMVADSFKSKISNFMKIDNISVIDVAKVPQKPVGPNKKLFILVGVIMSTGIVSLVILLKELSDTAVKSAEETAQLLGIPNLGTIGYIKKIDHLKFAFSEGKNSVDKKQRSRVARQNKS